MSRYLVSAVYYGLKAIQGQHWHRRLRKTYRRRVWSVAVVNLGVHTRRFLTTEER